VIKALRGKMIAADRSKPLELDRQDLKIGVGYAVDITMSADMALVVVIPA